MSTLNGSLRDKAEPRTEGNVNSAGMFTDTSQFIRASAPIDFDENTNGSRGTT